VWARMSECGLCAGKVRKASEAWGGMLACLLYSLVAVAVARLIS
jgi:hypothetical protein